MFQLKPRRRFILIATLLTVAVPITAGCPQSSPRPTQTQQATNNDHTALKRYITLPASVSSSSWQTGKFSGEEDWWLCAVLEFAPADSKQFFVGPVSKSRTDFPTSLKLDVPFDALQSLEGFGKSTQGAWCVAEAWSATPFESSPLLNGRVFKISESKAVVFMWTQ